MLFETIALLLLMAQAGATPQRSSVAVADENPDEVICRAAEPVLGSRVARRRICRTRAEWRAFREDRSQLRRDLQNAGACGSSPNCQTD